MYKWVPVVEAGNCSGCGVCIEACESQCLEVQDCLAVLSAPGNCTSDEACVPVCPTEAIQMQWVEMEADGVIGKWSEAAMA